MRKGRPGSAETGLRASRTSPPSRASRSRRPRAPFASTPPCGRQRAGGCVRRRRASATSRTGWRARLRTRISSFVGIVVPDITIPFFGLVVKAAQDVLEGAGYQVLVDEHAPRCRPGAPGAPHAALAPGRWSDGGDLRRTRSRASHPARLLRERRRGGRASLRVVLSNHEGIQLLVEHLAGHGHGRIAYIGGAPVVTSGSERLLGFRAAVAAAGLSDSALVRVSESWSAESAEQAATELLALSEAPTAFVAGGDTFALGHRESGARRRSSHPGRCRARLVLRIPTAWAAFSSRHLTTLEAAGARAGISRGEALAPRHRAGLFGDLGGGGEAARAAPDPPLVRLRSRACTRSHGSVSVSPARPSQTLPGLRDHTVRWPG